MAQSWHMEARGENWLETRTSLVRRLRDHRESESWEEFCDAYGPPIHAIALKSGLSREDAEDVLQETLISVAKALPEFCYDRDKGTFKSWVFTLARRRIVDWQRRLGREHRFEPPLTEDSSGTSFLERLPDEGLPDLSESYEAEWRRSLYQVARERVRNRISPEQFQIFDLCVTREWAVEKVAQTLGITANRVYVAKHRVSEALRCEVLRLEQGGISL